MLDALLRDPEIEAIVGDAAMARSMVQVEIGLARVQGELGVIEPGAAARIEAALVDFDPDLARIDDELRRSAVPVLALVEMLRARVGGAAAASLHRGATSQDIVDTALVLQLRRALSLLEERLRALIEALAAIAEAHADTVMVARTRYQQAQPTTFGLKAAGWIDPLVRHLDRLAELRPRLLVVQLGGAAGTLAALGDRCIQVMEALAAELGLACPAMPWHAQRDSMVELASWLALVSGALGKIGADVLLLAQSEVGEIRLAEGGMSSAMPQKSNPVVAEALVTLARQNATALASMAQALVHAHERDGAAWQLEWLTLPAMLGTTGAALLLGQRLAGSMHVDAGRMAATIEASQGLILAEAMSLELARHIPAEQARQLVAEACSAAKAEGRHLVDALSERTELRLPWKDLADPRRHLGVARELQERVLAAARAALDPMPGSSHGG